MLCIVLNIIIMGMVYDGMSDGYTSVLDLFNNIFALIFLLEAIIKIAALGPTRYFSMGWNNFDFAIVLTSVVDFVLIQVFDITTLSIYP